MFREQRLQFSERLARDEGLLLAARDGAEVFALLLDVGEAVAVGGDHGERFGLEDEQRAVEGVARLLVRDGEDGLRDEVAEGGDGQ